MPCLVGILMEGSSELYVLVLLSVLIDIDNRFCAFVIRIKCNDQNFLGTSAHQWIWSQSWWHFMLKDQGLLWWVPIRCRLSCQSHQFGCVSLGWELCHSKRLIDNSKLIQQMVTAALTYDRISLKRLWSTLCQKIPEQVVQRSFSYTGDYKSVMTGHDRISRCFILFLCDCMR